MTDITAEEFIDVTILYAEKHRISCSIVVDRGVNIIIGRTFDLERSDASRLHELAYAACEIHKEEPALKN